MRVIPHAELTPGLYWASYRFDKRETPRLLPVEVFNPFAGELDAYTMAYESEIDLRHLRFLCRIDPPDIDPQEAWDDDTNKGGTK